MMSKKRMHKTAIHERIELLEAESDRIRKELDDELQLTKKKASDIGKIALGIGGGLVLSAIILKGIFGSHDKDDKAQGEYRPKRVYHKFRDQLIGEISSQALVFILEIAKDKINSFLEKDSKTEKDDSEFID